MVIFCSIELPAEGRNDESFLIQLLHVFYLSFLLFLDLLTQITALSHPDFIVERSQSDPETQCHCWNQLGLVLRFLLSVPPRHPHGQVKSFFPGPVSLWKQVLREKLGNPVVEVLIWEPDNLSIGPYLAGNGVTEQSGLDRCLVDALQKFIS